MKTNIINLFLLPALIAGLGLIPTGRMTAQTFTTLHSFTAAPDPDYTNSDGAGPIGGLILSGNTLYGTASGGGSSGDGTVFKVNINGTGFTNLHSLTYSSDGASPVAELILSGNTLYGTALNGGSSGDGTVFKVNIDGTGFTNLHRFTATDGFGHNSDGEYPRAGLILSRNTLYGTAGGGGSSGNGTVFAINTDGTGFTTLYSFTAATVTFPYANSDGVDPVAGLILSGNTLYGTAEYGGSSGQGTVFAVNTDGTDFTTLHNFTGFPRDGADPRGRLILSGNTLYGTTYSGGSLGYGTVFGVHTDGTSFTNLHSFTGASNSTNSDGAEPDAGLVLSGNTLYGTTLNGGSFGYGTVFAVNLAGTGFMSLHSFTEASAPLYRNSDGAHPRAGLIVSGNTLYGTATQGGSSARGTVFSLSLPVPPQLTIIPSGANVILTWPTNATGFTLQCTSNLVSLTVWTTVSPGPVVVNGQNTVTNPISGPQKFFRLSK